MDTADSKALELILTVPGIQRQGYRGIMGYRGIQGDANRGGYRVNMGYR